MSKLILADGDTVTFYPKFDDKTIISPPGVTIEGSGMANIQGRKVCINGDEKSVVVKGVSYTGNGFVGGNGTLTIKSLDASKLAEFVTAGDKVILAGDNFSALFTVDIPGTDSSGNLDPNKTPAEGNCSLINSQDFVTVEKD